MASLLCREGDRLGARWERRGGSRHPGHRSVGQDHVLYVPTVSSAPWTGSALRRRTTHTDGSLHPVSLSPCALMQTQLLRFGVKSIRYFDVNLVGLVYTKVQMPERLSSPIASYLLRQDSWNKWNNWWSRTLISCLFPVHQQKGIEGRTWAVLSSGPGFKSCSSVSYLCDSRSSCDLEEFTQPL